MTRRWLKKLKMCFARPRLGSRVFDQITTAGCAVIVLVCIRSFTLAANGPAPQANSAESLSLGIESKNADGTTVSAARPRTQIHVSSDEVTEYFNEVGIVLATSTYLDAGDDLPSGR